MNILFIDVKDNTIEAELSDGRIIDVSRVQFEAFAEENDFRVVSAWVQDETSADDYTLSFEDYYETDRAKEDIGNYIKDVVLPIQSFMGHMNAITSSFKK